MENNPIGVFICAFFVSAFAGLASVLRGADKITFLKVVSSFLNMGLLGLAMSLIWYNNYKENVYFLIGAAGIAGLGGIPLLQIVLEVIKKKVSDGDFTTKPNKENDRDDAHADKT